MLAVITTGGKQYKVNKNSIINIENPNIKVGEKFSIHSVNMIQQENGDVLYTGKDKELSKACIIAKVVKLFKAPKIIVFKKRQRTNYRRKKGHKQHIAQVEIIEIKV